MPKEVRPEDTLRQGHIRAVDMIKQLQELYSRGEAGFSDYGQLQARFNAVMKLSKKDKDAMLSFEEVDRLAMEDQKLSWTASEKAAEAYQKELAAADPFYDKVETACLEVYGSKPVFHKEFAEENQRSYTAEQFNMLKPFDLAQLGSGVSEDEYAGLVLLGTADPDRCSGVLEQGGVFYNVHPKEELIFDNAASVGPAHMGHDKVTLSDGREVIAPRTNTGNTFDVLVEPARQDAKKALEAYGKGEKEPLAKLIAKGINSHIDNFGVFPGSEGKINPNTVSRLKLVLKTLPLLERDRELMGMARIAGLKPDRVRQLHGLDTYLNIRLAGAEAENRLRQFGEGKLELSAFEREQCALAVLRKRAVTEEAERSKYLFEHSAEYEDLEKQNEYLQDHPLEKFDLGNETLNDKLTTKYTNSVIHGAVERAQKAPEIIDILGEKGPGVLEGITARNAQFYSELFTAEGNALVEAVNKAADVTVSHDGKNLKEDPPKPIRTTAREIYNQLTEDYNKRRISYRLYDARIQTMRELTKGNPEAFIDLAAIDRGIMDAPKRHAKQLEESLRALEAEAAPFNKLQSRLDNVLGIYAADPRADERSFDKGYSWEQFALLKKISLDGISVGGQPVTQDEFAGVSIIAALDPQIGGRWTESHAKLVELPEDKRSFDTSVRNHIHYTLDLDQGNGAREKTGNWIERVIPGARNKAEEALKAYCAQPSDKHKLAGLIGLGLQAAAASVAFADNNKRALNSESLGDAILMAKVLPLLDRDPELKEKAVKTYGLKEEQIKNLRGCEAAFRIQRAAELAQKKIKDAAEGGKALSRSEKEICVEAILRCRMLAVECAEHAGKKIKENETRVDALAMEVFRLQTEDQKLRQEGITDSPRQKEIVSAVEELNEKMMDLQSGSGVGLPDVFKELADKGPEIMGQRLAERMPGKAALLAMSDSDLNKLFDSGKDLFKDNEYKELKAGVWVQDVEARKALEEHRAKQNEQQSPVKGL